MILSVILLSLFILVGYTYSLNYVSNADDLNEFYDLAGVSKNGQHTDINSYIDALPSARMALRTAKDNNFNDQDWLELIKIIKQKKT